MVKVLRHVKMLTLFFHLELHATTAGVMLVRWSIVNATMELASATVDIQQQRGNVVG